MMYEVGVAKGGGRGSCGNWCLWTLLEGSCNKCLFWIVVYPTTDTSPEVVVIV